MGNSDGLTTESKPEYFSRLKKGRQIQVADLGTTLLFLLPSDILCGINPGSI